MNLDSLHHVQRMETQIALILFYVNLGCYNKTIQKSVWFINKNTYISHFWRVGNSRLRHQQISCLVRSASSQRTIFSPCPPWWKGCRSSLGSLLQGHSLHPRGLYPHDLIIPPKLNSNTITLGVRFQHMDIEEHKHTDQSKAKQTLAMEKTSVV